MVKALIQVILNHPEGFSGEIIIADNCQGQYGSTCHGGSFDYSKNNAQDISQSMQRVANSFLDNRVSSYHWGSITTKTVKEYAQGDDEDGYIVDDVPNPHTGILVSYLKFTIRYGTKVSFKKGVWNPKNQTYESGRLKVINVPVLKSHSIYGVTASLKHYMGVVSDKLTAQLGTRANMAHYAIAPGGLGTEMVETRIPTLNIIDAIWVKANPWWGPNTPYSAAKKTNVIAASIDPVALDYWGDKNILVSVAKRLEYNDLSS